MFIAVILLLNCFLLKKSSYIWSQLIQLLVTDLYSSVSKIVGRPSFAVLMMITLAQKSGNSFTKYSSHFLLVFQCLLLLKKITPLFLAPHPQAGLVPDSRYFSLLFLNGRDPLPSGKPCFVSAITG